MITKRLNRLDTITQRPHERPPEYTHESVQTTEGFTLEFAAEVQAADNASERVNRIRSELQELRRQKTSLFGKLVTERERKQRFEMAVFRKRLKGKERQLSA
jgi:hypothetical protein